MISRLISYTAAVTFAFLLLLFIVKGFHRPTERAVVIRTHVVELLSDRTRVLPIHLYAEVGDTVCVRQSTFSQVWKVDRNSDCHAH